MGLLVSNGLVKLPYFCFSDVGSKTPRNLYPDIELDAVMTKESHKICGIPCSGSGQEVDRTM